MSEEKMLEDFGIMTEYVTYPIPLYDFKKLHAYCDAHNTTAAELDDEVRDQFIIEWITPNTKA